jgi:MarR family
VKATPLEALAVVGYRLTDRDFELLAFLAEHRLALPVQVAVLLGISATAATARLNRLAKAGLVRSDEVLGRSCQITRRGLATIGSSLPTPRVDLRTHEHDVGVAWLWIVARAQTL